MIDAARRSRWTLVALLAGACALGAWVWWVATYDPTIPFLTRAKPAEWIVYPTAPTLFTRPIVEQDAVFRQSFVLERKPASAVLRARTYRRGAIAINGTLAAPAGADEDWKRARELDVSALLREGENEVVARVRNHFGPPALWLAVEGEGIGWKTDASWTVSLAGASWQPARLATIPMDQWEPAPGEPPPSPSARPRAFDAARRSLPVWVVFAAIVTLLLAASRLTRGGSVATAHDRAAVWLAALAAVAWAALMWNNGTHPSDRLFGFDVEGHLKYVEYVLSHGRLPLADEGWEMYQPPLYYLMAAAVVRAFGYTTLEYETLALLRAINVAGGLVLLAALFGSLRLMFPTRPRRWVTGFCLGAFLPAQLYMVQYLSNETWAATWAAVTVYACLRLLRRAQPTLGNHLLLGTLLGGGLLTKFSFLMVAGPVAGVLAGRLLAGGERSPVVYARTLGAVLLAGGLVCAWHFVRVTARFGTPLVGNWDPASGFLWWQDPGYQTVDYYTGFGLSLVEPIFSSFHSFADGIFSTLWGDGMVGGSGQRDLRPPWNYDLMIGGYLLACLPSLAIFVGVAAAIVDLVRNPRAEWFLVLGVLGATAFAIFVMTLRLPFQSQAKAFYGLGTLVPLAILGARGFDVLGGRSAAVRVLLSLALGVWTLNACASFWIRG